VKITSAYASDSAYNKILGIFDPLGHPYDTPAYTAGITLVIWGGIGIGVFLLFRSTTHLIFRKSKETARDIGNKTGAMLAASIIIYGLSNAAMVYGIDEIVIAALQNIASILYIPIIAYIVWNIYTNLIKLLFHKLEDQDKISGADTSLIPLFNMLGKILIVVVAASALLGSMGFDLVAIMTGAGIAGMAISLGAQNTLTEFFSGLNLLATRPFKRGDMIMVGGKDIYQVEKVGMLNSRFKNWISMEYIIIPNSTVVSSTILNITGQTMAYRITLAYTVAYDSDVALVKQILLDTAYNHPQVIIDGSYSKPSVRLKEFQDSAIEFTLNVFITDFRDYISVTDELNEDVYRNLCKAGIEIPFNKLDVYIASEEDDGQ
ncbi:MAG: mechanosensitive ion channel family protein, partial [Candidatus Methanomethylophilaceae archaeon]|nr:mechanosensitive ion channel family protein [Candidatus Methanomethylophilaceae archaeon]